jgi:hypothetical protein
MSRIEKAVLVMLAALSVLCNCGAAVTDKQGKELSAKVGLAAVQ